MATLQADSNLPELTPAQSLEGWRREFCIKLLGDGGARIFVRSVEQGSLKANELKRAMLFHRVALRFTDVAGCVEAIQHDSGIWPIRRSAPPPPKTTCSPQ